MEVVVHFDFIMYMYVHNTCIYTLLYAVYSLTWVTMGVFMVDSSSGVRLRVEVGRGLYETCVNGEGEGGGDGEGAGEMVLLVVVVVVMVEEEEDEDDVEVKEGEGEGGRDGEAAVVETKVGGVVPVPVKVVRVILGGGVVSSSSSNHASSSSSGCRGSLRYRVTTMLLPCRMLGLGGGGGGST